MAYIVERKTRFYVVAYDGIDPTSGRERRRWHPAGHNRADAEAIAARLHAIAAGDATIATGHLTLGRYLTEQFMPMRRHRLQPTTAHRYEWMIDNYINPALGSMPLRSVRAEHLDRLYGDLLTTGGVKHTGLAPKTVYDVHVVVRSAFTQAVRQHLVAENPAVGAQAPRSRPRQRSGPECWTAAQLSQFLRARADRSGGVSTGRWAVPVLMSGALTPTTGGGPHYACTRTRGAVQVVGGSGSSAPQVR